MDWLLFSLWVLFNLMDILLSWLCCHYGAAEIGLLYNGFSSWGMASSLKIVLAVGIGVVLVFYEKRAILSVLTALMACLCTYEVWLLYQVM